MKRVSPILILLFVSLLTTTALATTFTNSTSINTPATSVGAGAADLYPSTINVAGMSGTITSVNVTLWNINEPRPDDLEVLLVGPTGAQLLILTDAGGTSAASGVSPRFSDAAPAGVPDAGPLTTAVFLPTSINSSATTLPLPAPAPPYTHPAPWGSATFSSVFNGSNPNGTWSLYVADDVSSGTGGSISGGWTIDITTSASIQQTTTTLTSSLNPSRTGQGVTFRATAHRTSDNALITTGTFTFREGGVTLAGPLSPNGVGQVAYSTSALSEGVHTISCDYNGAAGFGQSTTNVVQTVDNNTIVNSNNFQNLGSITIPDSGTPGVANVYPSHIFVTGLTGTISKVTVNVNNLSHGNPQDLEMLLVSPNGANLVLLSDAGGSTDASGVTLVFDDAAGAKVPGSGPLVSGTFKPTSINSTPENFPAPAPPGPHDHPSPFGAATLQSAFNGVSPNGTWNLYVVDDVSGVGGTIAGGWGLTFTMSSDAATVTTLASSQNPSVVSNSVTFTATVKSGGTAVTNGSVTFREGQSTLAGPVALNGAGLATFNTSALAEGSHVITALYSGSAGAFNVSDTNLTQVVDGITSIVGSQFCNSGTITIPATGSPGLANVYPSHINVSGLSANITKVVVTLNGITHPNADDLEVLLVGPQGQQLVLMSDAGGNNALNNVTITLDDFVDSSLPDSTPFGSGTFRPTSYNSTPANFPSPAPASPYSHAAPAGVNTLTSKFAGVNPNGTWSLYVVDDVSSGDATGTIAGWCLTLMSSQPQYYITAGLTNGAPRMSFVGSPGTSYYFQRATTLPGPWTNVTPLLLAPPSGLLEFQDTNAPLMPRRFYRTKVGP